MPEHDAHGHGGHDAHGAHGGHESPLENILHALNPETIRDKVTVPNNEARNTYEIKNHTITEYDKFTAEVTAYVKHHLNKVHRAEGISDEHAFSQAYQIISQRLRRQGGFKHAFELAKDGKVRQVIDILAEHFEQEAQEGWMTYNTTGKIDEDDLETQTGIVRELFQRMAKIRPEGSRELRNPEMHARDYASIAQTYLELVKTTDRYAVPSAGHGDHATAGGHH